MDASLKDPSGQKKSLSILCPPYAGILSTAHAIPFDEQKGKNGLLVSSAFPIIP